MPRDSNGNYALPSGNPVVNGTVINPTTHNNTMNDIASEMQDSLSRSGKGGMLAPFQFDDGTESLPGATFADETNSGLYRAGTNDIRATLAGDDILQLATSVIKIISHAADAADAVGVTMDTVNAFATSGAKLLSILTNAVEKASIDKDGNYSGGGTFQALAAVAASVKGNQADGASAVGVILDCLNALSTSGAKAVSIRNNAVEKANIDKDGNFYGGGTFQALAANPATVKGNDSNGTADAAGVITDCENAISGVDGSSIEKPILSVCNAGTEQLRVTATGSIITGGSSVTNPIYVSHNQSSSGIASYQTSSGAAIVAINDGSGSALQLLMQHYGGSAPTRGALFFDTQTTPSSPQNGDVWFDGTNIKMRIGGATKTFTLT